MFSVRAFFSVAGVLLISDAAQAKVTGRLDCKGNDANDCLRVYLQVAEEETQQAHQLLTRIELKEREKATVALTDAQSDFKKLQDGVKKPMQDLKNALTLLVGAYETVEGNCKNNDECEAVLTHIGKSVGYTVAAIEKVTDFDKQQQIGDLYVQYFRGKDLADEKQAEDLYLFGGEVLEVLSEPEVTDSEDN